VAVACGAYALALGQDKNWDLLNYHLYNPYALLNGRVASDLGPAGLQSWFSPMLDLLYYGAVTHLHPKTVGFLLGFLQGLNFLLLYKIAARLLNGYGYKQLFALLLALAAVLTVGFQAEIGTSMHDSLVALLPLSALLLVLNAIGRLSEPGLKPVFGLVATAGLVAGIGIGLKLVSAIYALGLCLSLLIIPIKWLDRFRLTLVFGFPVLFGMLLVGGYWMYTMWELFGNPLFPQFNHIFRGELATFEPMRDTRFLPKTWFDKVFYPVIFTLDPYRAAELAYKQYSWLAAYAAVIGLAIAKLWSYVRRDSGKRPWSPESAYLLTFFFVSYFLWLNIFGIYRYLIVIELLIPLLLFMIMTHLLKSRRGPILALAAVAILTVVNLPGAPSWGRAGWADTVFRVEPGPLTDGPEPAAVYLAGQPIAWIVPAMDIRAPFIQIVPNFPISESYWHRAIMLPGDRAGKRFIVFESDNEQIAARTDHAMMKLGISVNENTCDKLVAYLGADRIEYRYCEVEMTESQ
jgi:hypothetical protein